jgi:hypothetical protein
LVNVSRSITPLVEVGNITADYQRLKSLNHSEAGRRQLVLAELERNCFPAPTDTSELLGVAEGRSAAW